MWRVVLVSMLGSTVREAREQQASTPPTSSWAVWGALATGSDSLFVSCWLKCVEAWEAATETGTPADWLECVCVCVCVGSHMECE